MISIVIPTYEMNGVGSFFIEKSLSFISKQTFTEFEVVISDHSINDEIYKISNKFTNLKINYIKNEFNRGSSSSNLNNAILNSKYNIIKFLMQDEYIFDENTLLDIKKSFDDENCKWVATGCFYGNNLDTPIGNMIPYYSDKIIEGYNTIGSPSIISIRKTNDLELFDPNLIWMMDCDYYKRTFDKWGHPKIIPEYKIFVNQHKNQVTNLISDNVKNYENQLIRKKYNQ